MLKPTEKICDEVLELAYGEGVDVLPSVRVLLRAAIQIARTDMLREVLEMLEVKADNPPAVDAVLSIKQE